MTLLRPALLLPIVLVAAACAGAPTTSPTATLTASPTAIASTPPAAPTTAGELVIDVALTDEMRIEPASMTVRAGQPVRFVVTNTGAIEHEFFLGDEEAQAAHEVEMAHGGMAHDEPNGVFVEPGETKELVFTFAPGEWLAGCHVPGHYPAGMKAEITVQP